MDTREVLFGAVAVVGVALLLYGLSMPSFTGELVVDEPVSDSEVDQDEVVAYEDLSSENRAAFDRALEGDGETNYQHHRWNAEAVAYEGQYYPTSTSGGENAWRLYATIGGWIVIAIGVAGIGGLRAMKWLRQSSGSNAG